MTSVLTRRPVCKECHTSFDLDDDEYNHETDTWEMHHWFRCDCFNGPFDWKRNDADFWSYYNSLPGAEQQRLADAVASWR